MPRSKRKEREIQRVRQDILDSAATIFSRVGYNGATMQEIAREAGYSAPSLYAYFKGKEAILMSLSASFLSEVLAVFEEPLPRGLVLEQSLELLMRRLLELCDHRRAAVIVFFNFMTLQEPLPLKDDRGATHVNNGNIIIDRAAAWLEANVSPEELGDKSPEDAATFIFGVVYTFFVRWLRSGSEGKLTDLLPLTLSLVLHGLGQKKSP